MDLTDAQLGELRVQLETLARQLEAMLAGSADAAKPVELDQPAMGRVSRVDAIQQQQMIEASRGAQRARLQQVRAALHRFEEDVYGECVTCGEAIGHARLEVAPETPFCVGCQGARERR